MCGLTLVITWIADMYYDDSFVVNDLKWRGHIICFIIFNMSVMFSKIMPFSLTCLSVARLMVVKYPFKTTLKTKWTTTMHLSIAQFIISLFSIAMSLNMKHRGLIPSNLCSPYFQLLQYLKEYYQRNITSSKGAIRKSLILLSWPENQGILFFVYFSNISNEPDIFHGCTS